MKKFKQFVIESDVVSDTISSAKKNFPNKSKFKWNSNPKIGWWKDRNTLIMYHGTHYSNLESMLENGIWAPTSGPTANWVSLALEPNTAFGYASMGGESGFRAAGSKAVHIPKEERIVLVLKMNLSYILKNIETNFRGNIEYTRNRLTDKTEYESWKKSDQEYYALTELRFPKKVDPKFIMGYMVKK